MFGLRKRAKQIEDEQINVKNSIDFSRLPNEIYFCIFDNLSLADLLNLRLLNSFFKSLIDNSKFIWKNISINIDFNQRTDIENVIKFIKTKSTIRKICINCPNILSKKQIKHQQNLRLNDINFEYSLRFDSLNVYSLSCLNYFPNSSKIKINSFINTKCVVVGSKLQEYSNIDLEPFKNVTSFDLNCLVFDSKNNKQFIWDNVFEENCLINRLAYLFPNIKQFRISFYNDCIYELLKKISKLSCLSLIEFDNCKDSNIINMERKFSKFKRKRRLKISNFKFISCPFSTIFYCLQNLSDLLFCECVVLIGKDEFLIEDEKENEYFKKCLEIISSMSNLKRFETNIYQLKNNYVLNRQVLEPNFYSKLTHLSFLDNDSNWQKFKIERFNQIFINNKITFPNLRSLNIRLCLECKEKFFLKILIEYFLNNSPQLIYLELQARCIYFNCNNTEFCSLFKTGFGHFKNGYFYFKFNIKNDDKKIKKFFD